MSEELNDDKYPIKGKGRPSHAPGKPKKPRNLTITNEAWENLETMSREFGLGSVSQLIENIGTKKLEIHRNSQIDGSLNAEAKSQQWQEQKEEASKAFVLARYLECDLDR